MKGGSVLVVIVLIVLGVYGSLNYHFILMDSSVKALKKTEMSLEYTFVDARGMKKAKLFLVPTLVKAGIKDVFTDDSIEVGK